MAVYEDTLFSRMPEEGGGDDVGQVLMGFINLMEGWKTKCRNLVWSAPKHNVRAELLKFGEALCRVQCGLAEEYMGIFGRMQPNALKPVQDDCLNADDFLACVKAQSVRFMEKVPCEPAYKGIGFMMGKFMHMLNVAECGFRVCDVRPY